MAELSGIFKPPFGAQLKRDFPWPAWPAGFWLFNEGSGDTVYDLSGGGHHGTLHGGCSWEEGGLKLDGTSGTYVEVPHWDGLDNLERFSAIAFIKTGTIGGGERIIAWEDTSLMMGVFFGVESGNAYYVRLGDTSGHSSISFLAECESDKQMVAIVTNDKNDITQLFDNGAKETHTPIGHTTGESPKNLTFGAKWDGRYTLQATLQLIALIPATIDQNLASFLTAFPYAPLKRP